MRILVTGGSGFLGQAIMLNHPEHSYVVYSPNALNQSYARDITELAHIDASYVLGDVRNLDPLKSAAKGCDAIIHAGAIKYVPQSEKNVGTCIGVNVQGSENVVAAALYNNTVQAVIGVSTDKACMPISVYGATKLLMERMFTSIALSDIVFHTVRFGNFVGSTGSVIPKMLNQARMTGSITITDPIMTRYWMAPKQVADILVGLCAYSGDIGLTNGSVLIPKDPPAMTLAALVRTIKEMISDKLIVNEIGPRPGEKTHEMLLCHEESVHTLPPGNGDGNGTPGFYEFHPSFPETTSFKLISSSPSSWLEPADMIPMIKEALQLVAAGVS
jgi:UDP-N-acetylglucosamine 4,6-dehydratase